MIVVLVTGNLFQQIYSVFKYVKVMIHITSCCIHWIVSRDSKLSFLAVGWQGHSAEHHKFVTRVFWREDGNGKPQNVNHIRGRNSCPRADTKKRTENERNYKTFSFIKSSLLSCQEIEEGTEKRETTLQSVEEILFINGDV